MNKPSFKELFVESPPKNEIIGRLRRWGAAVVGVAALVGFLEVAQNVREDNKDKRPTVEQIVEPGDTLYKIAGPYAREKDVDIRDGVDDIIENSPDTKDGLHPGDKLVVPATDAQIQNALNKQYGNVQINNDGYNSHNNG